MRIMTCNIRTSAAWDEENNWCRRRDLCCDVIRSRGPDVVGCQEVREDQAADLIAAFSEFGSYGLPDEPGGAHPMNLVLFRRETFRLLSAGGFWLSETPHVPGSTSWDSACIRLANWVQLLHKEAGAEVLVINTHLDHKSQAAREGQARVINEWAAAFPDEQVRILAGDLNANPDNAVIRCFKEAGWRSTYEAVHGAANPGCTCHGFLGNDPSKDHEPWARKIDWVFLKGRAKVVAAEIVRDSRDGRYPSDHYFLAVELEI